MKELNSENQWIWCSKKLESRYRSNRRSNVRSVRTQCTENVRS